ncbi:hypothetical protein PO909_004282 [Leuciscus waleckii]
MQLTSWWKRKDTEVVVSVIPTQNIGQTIIVRHRELRTLQPHRWLYGEIIEGLFHLAVNQLEMGSSIYILNHYTAWVILHGESSQLVLHSLSKVNFDHYQAVLSFVNICEVHWKLLYINAVNHTVYLMDPSRNNTEKADSTHAAQKFSEYLQMRKTCHGITEWVDIKWKGGVLAHPVQQDASSCGVIVTLMARAVVRAFPAVPVFHFGTSKKEMAQERKKMALQILKESGL